MLENSKVPCKFLVGITVSSFFVFSTYSIRPKIEFYMFCLCPMRQVAIIDTTVYVHKQIFNVCSLLLLTFYNT